MIISLEDPSTYSEMLSGAFQNKDLKSLTIKIEENQNRWMVYPIEQGIDTIENNADYSFKYELLGLPDSLCQLENLEELVISFLGLEELPRCLPELQKLRVLDISFNDLEFEKVAMQISELPSLEVLKVYGSHLTNEQLDILLSVNPSLKIKYAKKDFLKEMSEK